MIQKYLPILFLLLIVKDVSSQDLHFSQPIFQPTYFNTAQTGIFEGTTRFAGIFRSQWNAVPVSYQTVGAMADSKILQKGNWQFSGGLLLLRDKAGDAALIWTQIGISSSAAYSLSPQQVLSIGFSACGVQRTFDISNLRFKNQWNGEQLDLSRPNKETFQNSSKFQPSLAFGVNYHLQQEDSRNYLNIGVNTSHLNRPVVSFENAPTELLPIRWVMGADACFQISAKKDFVFFAQHHQMLANRATLIGAGYRYWLAYLPGKKIGLQIAGAYRVGDALVPNVQMFYNTWTFGFSYDLNISDFAVATQRRGGFELGLMYRVVPVPPVKSFKSCPIF